ncbi:MAG: T9SS type A sorting domain-containing protein [Salinivirgaceae bacterium]|nr:T9SS type A sorting domain-containing protein [Salinivirgaceae bacterium]
MRRFLQLLAFFIGISSLNAQTIYEIQGQAAASPYADQVVTTQGIVTAVYSGSYFIQDGDSEWTGLYIFDNTQAPALGDSISITGTIVEYFEMTEMKDITAFSVLSSGNTVPEAILITTGEASEAYESVFIKVENATCTNPDLGYGEWEINDGTGAIVVNDLGVAYTPIIDVNYHITGPMDYSFGNYKIEPRTIDDIVQDLSLFITKTPIASNITNTSFDVEWETNAEASAYFEYGLTTDYEIGTAFSTVSSTTHTISVENLDAGNIYYGKAYSINIDNDTTPIHHGAYVTQSESSGEILSYFNEMYIALGKNIVETSVKDTIIAYIEKAQTSLDVAVYDLTNHSPNSDSSNYEIIQAINTAYDNGVNVRFITDDSPTNTALESLNSSINIVRGNATAIMHNKFLIIDSESVTNSWVLTGSTNWTYNNLFMDFNNLVCIQDQSLAKSYELEFNEMWGSNTLIPDLEKGKFGNEKEDNTPHFFNINNSNVELYFSPSDKTTAKIVNVIDQVEDNLSFAMMVFTEDNLGNAIINAKERGVDIFGIIDYVESSGSEFDNLLANNVDVIDFVNANGESWPTASTLHHKFLVADFNQSNPVVVTGTHNWSASAESKNDENTLIIYNAETANAFIGEVLTIEDYIYSDIASNIAKNHISVYPNPNEGNFTIEFDTNKKRTIEILDGTGRLVNKINILSKTQILSIENSGIYFIKVSDENHVFSTQKIIIQ